MLNQGWKVSEDRFRSKGKLESIFAWGLRESTNNQMEAYACLHDLFLAIELRIKNFIVKCNSSTIIKLVLLKSLSSNNKIISNSSTIIKLVLLKFPSSDNNIISIINQYQKEVNNFQKILFYEALQEHNHKQIQ